MRYDLLYKHNGKKHKSARIYTDTQLGLAVKHAKDVNGKVVCRETGKIMANFCKEDKK